MSSALSIHRHQTFEFTCPGSWRVRDDEPLQVTHAEHGVITVAVFVAPPVGADHASRPRGSRWLTFSAARDLGIPGGHALSWTAGYGGTLLMVTYFRDDQTPPEGITQARQIVESIRILPQVEAMAD